VDIVYALIRNMAVSGRCEGTSVTILKMCRPPVSSSALAVLQIRKGYVAIVEQRISQPTVSKKG
jgi:hypothetical protein